MGLLPGCPCAAIARGSSVGHGARVAEDAKGSGSSTQRPGKDRGLPASFIRSFGNPSPAFQERTDDPTTNPRHRRHRMDKAEHDRSDQYLVAQMRIDARRAWRRPETRAADPAGQGAQGSARPTPLARGRRTASRRMRSLPDGSRQPSRSAGCSNGASTRWGPRSAF